MPTASSRPTAEEGSGARVAPRRSGGPGRRLAVLVRSGLFRVAALIYGLGARLDRVRGRRARARRGRPSCAVVSVGGLTVGGAGKTPMAAWLATALAARGHRVAIASRGYRGRPAEAVTVVSDGRRVRSEMERAGDEAMVLASRAVGVPVLVGADRVRVGHQAVALFDTEILILDDGFQHHGLDRDFDLVCLDAHAGVGNGRLLPAGPLREPVSALKHADAFCWVGVEGAEDPGIGAGPAPGRPRRLLRAIGDERPVHAAVRRALDCVPLGGGPACPTESLAGECVGLVSGLARPAGFRRLVEGLGATVVRELRFPDHYAYAPEDLAPLRDGHGHGRGSDGSDAASEERPPSRWLTTEKDAFKILPDWVSPTRVDVLRIGVVVEDDDALLDRVEATLRERGRLR